MYNHDFCHGRHIRIMCFLNNTERGPKLPARFRYSLRSLKSTLFDVIQKEHCSSLVFFLFSIVKEQIVVAGAGFDPTEACL